ncbi:MAG: hypothetical protein D6694_15455 [Gammaproteobacteria bacterium]|nr:MAG: hypothetical protein D6694_15455 [Gammaproteobacteria bacterium]
MSDNRKTPNQSTLAPRRFARLLSKDEMRYVHGACAFNGFTKVVDHGSNDDACDNDPLILR